MFGAVVEVAAFLAAGFKLTAILRMKLWHPEHHEEVERAHAHWLD